MIDVRSPPRDEYLREVLPAGCAPLNRPGAPFRMMRSQETQLSLNTPSRKASCELMVRNGAHGAQPTEMDGEST